MQLQSTPVKRPTISKIIEDSDDSFIRRPSDGGNIKRRISAPIREIPEQRIAPDQVIDAPRAWRSRRLTLDSLTEVVSLMQAPSTPLKELSERKKKESGTPRRRSTQLVNVLKTPTASIRRRSEESSTTLKRSKSFGSLAPLRPHRVETRKVLRDPEVVKSPLFN